MSTSYRLREGLSYCRVDGQVIFLDIQNDRYFRLSGSVEAAFIAFVEGGRISAAEVDSLARNNILSTASRTESDEPSLPVTPQPIHSAVELPDPTGSLNPMLLLEVTTSVLTTWWMLKTRRLAEVIDSFVSFRRKHAKTPTSGTTIWPDPRVCEAAISFHRARLYVPVRTSCLLDSLALARFLSRRQIGTSLVFGITRVPFAAHCWVQFSDTVLNDTVGNVTSHTPIRVV
ncbi:MAG: lasso peptide biosynthesis B2 protein [Rhodanobacter sp.]